MGLAGERAGAGDRGERAARMRMADRQPERVGGVLAGQAGQREQALTISWTCSLRAWPWPTTAFFICSAVYSDTARSVDTSAVSAAPRAWPSSSVDCGLTLTKTISTEAQVGP